MCPLLLLLSLALALSLGGCSLFRPAPGGDQALGRYHYQLAYGYLFENGEVALAYQEILKSIEAYNRDPEALLLAGILSSERERPLDAIRYYQRSLELDSNFNRARNNLGTVYLQQGQWEQALPHFQRLLDDRSYRSPARARNNLAFAFFKLGRPAEARPLLEAAIRLNHRLCPPYHNLGEVLVELEEYEEAEQAFTQGTIQCPDYPAPFFHLGQLLIRQRRLQEGIAPLQRCLALAERSRLGRRCAQLLSSIGAPARAPEAPRGRLAPGQGISPETAPRRDR